MAITAYGQQPQIAIRPVLWWFVRRRWGQGCKVMYGGRKLNAIRLAQKENVFYRIK